MSDRRRDVIDVKSILQRRIDSLCQLLVPDGRQAGPYWMCRNPTRNDTHLGSMWVRTRGNGVGTWADEATGDGAAQAPNGKWKKDVFGLIMYVKGLAFKDAMAWARDFTGIEELPDVRIREARRFVENQALDAARMAREIAAKRRRALAFWLDASPDILDTPVDTYLRGRGIDLRALDRIPRALRVAWRKHPQNGRRYPVMIAIMTGPDPKGQADGTCYGIHTTWIQPDGSGKASLGGDLKARNVWPGGYSGASIRLTWGQYLMRPSDAAKQGLLDTLCLCEGIEDGLSIALACPHLRVWAAINVGNIQKIVLPACAGEVIVAADNDWGKPQAKAQLDAGVRALEAQGRPVRVARSLFGKDANDALLSAPPGADQNPARAYCEAGS